MKAQSINAMKLKDISRRLGETKQHAGKSQEELNTLAREQKRAAKTIAEGGSGLGFALKKSALRFLYGDVKGSKKAIDKGQVDTASSLIKETWAEPKKERIAPTKNKDILDKIELIEGRLSEVSGSFEKTTASIITMKKGVYAKLNALVKLNKDQVVSMDLVKKEVISISGIVASILQRVSPRVVMIGKGDTRKKFTFDPMAPRGRQVTAEGKTASERETNRVSSALLKQPSVEKEPPTKLDPIVAAATEQSAKLEPIATEAPQANLEPTTENSVVDEFKEEKATIEKTEQSSIPKRAAVDPNIKRYKKISDDLDEIKVRVINLGTGIAGSGSNIVEDVIETVAGAAALATAGGAAKKVLTPIKNKTVAGPKGGGSEKVSKVREKPTNKKLKEIKSAGNQGTKLTEKLGAKGLTKGAGKSLLKKIPIVGLLAGGAFAAKAAMDGDMTGAGLELASGAASMIPGVGTAASLAIDAYSASRDITPSSDKKQMLPSISNIGDKISKESAKLADTAKGIVMQPIVNNTTKVVPSKGGDQTKMVSIAVRNMEPSLGTYRASVFDHPVSWPGSYMV